MEQQGQGWPPVSPDGRWWWDGLRWRSLLSADGRFRWDGRRWVETEARQVHPRVSPWSPTGYYPEVGFDNWMRGRRAPLGIVITAVVLAVLVLVGSVAWYLVQSNGHGSGGDTKALQDFIPVAERFVEEHRGLKFKEPVKVTFLSDHDFQARLQPQGGSDPAAIEQEFKELRALGLIDPGVDIKQAESALMGGGVLGYYDPQTKELVVRGNTSGPEVRHVLVHELTHALQDQNFSLSPLGAQSNDEKPEAFRSVAEGDAVTIEDQYIATLTVAERAEILRIESQQASGIEKVPPVLIEILLFPYQAGPSFIKAVKGARGQPGVDGAFTKPPTTTAELIHPDKFLAGFTPTLVDRPPADAKSFDDGILGEMGLDLILEPMLRSGILSQTEYARATGGWTGDHYVAWDQGSTACVRAHFVVDGPTSATSLIGALQKYVGLRKAAKLDAASNDVTLTSCG